MSANLCAVQIGKYYIDFKQVLGKGNSGNVYKGINTQTKEPLAIKVIDMRKIKGEVTQYLLESEKKALTSIKSPYVIRAQQIIQHQDHCYIIMQFCAKGSLKDYIATQGKLSCEAAVELFKKIVSGYLVISQSLFIHRDLKTANILVRSNGEPVIIDFGYCQMMMNTKKPTMQYNVGTPSYMSPEVYSKSRYSQKADVWSLGAILYEMLTGKTLDEGLESHIYFMNLQKQGKPRIQFEGMNQVCKDLLQASLQVNPENRVTSHKLKYIIDKSLIPQIQNQLNKVLGQQPSKNYKFVPATHFNYEQNKSQKNNGIQYRNPQTCKNINSLHWQETNNFNKFQTPSISILPKTPTNQYQFHNPEDKFFQNSMKGQIMKKQQQVNYNGIQTQPKFNFIQIKIKPKIM